EALDLAQRHRMMSLRFDVLDPVLRELPLEPSRSPPVRILPAPVREHLLRGPVLADRPAIHLQHLVRRLSPAKLQAYHVPGVVIDKPDQIGVAAPQAEGEDIRLPQLVRGGALKGTRAGDVATRLVPGGNDQ